MEYKVFISHAGEDAWVAQQIQKNISLSGAGTFLDIDNIQTGDNFEDKFLEAIRESDELLILFTSWSLERPYVWLEMGAALSLKKKGFYFLVAV